MTTVIIGISLIAYSNLFAPLMKIASCKPSRNNAAVFMLIGFLVAGIVLYINYNKTTIGSLVVIIICAIGSIIRIATIDKQPFAKS